MTRHAFALLQADATLVHIVIYYYIFHIVLYILHPSIHTRNLFNITLFAATHVFADVRYK